MALPRFFPYVGAVVAIAAIVLAIIGISSDYWWSAGGYVHTGLWRDCGSAAAKTACIQSKKEQPSALAIAGLISVILGALLAIVSGVLFNKSDGSNTVARLCGSISVILLFSAGVLVAASLFSFSGISRATGYSFALMGIAQFLSFLAAMLVAYWMGHAYVNAA